MKASVRMDLTVRDSMCQTDCHTVGSGAVLALLFQTAFDSWKVEFKTSGTGASRRMLRRCGLLPDRKVLELGC